MKSLLLRLLVCIEDLDRQVAVPRAQGLKVICLYTADASFDEYPDESLADWHRRNNQSF